MKSYQRNLTSKSFVFISPMPSCLFLQSQKKQRRTVFQSLNPLCQGIRPGVVITKRPLNKKPFVKTWRSPQASSHLEPQVKQNIEPFIARVKNYKAAFDFYQKKLKEAPNSKFYAELEIFFKSSIPLTALFLLWMKNYVITDPDSCVPLKMCTDSFNSFLQPYQIPGISSNKVRSAMEIVWKYSNSDSKVSSINLKRVSRGNILEGVKLKKTNKNEKGGFTHGNQMASI